MKIYQFGESVRTKIYKRSGDKNNDTYACEFEFSNSLTMHKAFEKMCAELILLGIKIKQENFPEIITTTGDTYIVCHETVVHRNNVINVPCNILRHVLNQSFTRDTLYIDENGHIVDLHKTALIDINDDIYEITKSLALLIKQDENILIDILELYIKKGARIGRLLSQQLSDFDSYATKPITVISSKFSEILSVKHFGNFINFINNYQQLKEYFMIVCGLEFTATLNPKPLPPRPAKPTHDKKPSIHDIHPGIFIRSNRSNTAVTMPSMSTIQHNQQFWSNVREIVMPDIEL